MPVLTLLEVAKMNMNDPLVPLIEEALPSNPEAQILPFRQISGTSFKSLVRTANPTITFRAANEGTTPVKSTYANKLFDLFYLDGQLQIDKAVATGVDRGVEFAQTTEASGAVTGALTTLGKQVWYGIGGGGDAKGFPGASEIVDSTLVIDAGGTTAGTGSSVYFVVALPGFMEMISGRDMVLGLGTWREQTVIDSNGKNMTAYVNSLEGWIGAAFYNKYAIVRIRDLTADSGKGLTDSLLADARALFPVGVQPTHIFMSRRSRTQLQKSRTVVLNGNGTNRPNQANLALTPTDYEGVPIIATDSILDTESLS